MIFAFVVRRSSFDPGGISRIAIDGRPRGLGAPLCATVRFSHWRSLDELREGQRR